MAYYRGRFTCPSSTGNFTISSLPFTPVRAKFTTGAKSGSINSESRRATGWVDSNNADATALIVNSNGNFSKNYTDGTCLVVLSTPGGVAGEEVQATLSSFGTNQCVLNFSKTSSNYQVIAEFWDS